MAREAYQEVTPRPNGRSSETTSRRRRLPAVEIALGEVVSVRLRGAGRRWRRYWPCPSVGTGSVGHSPHALGVATWRSGYAPVCKAGHVGSNPAVASKFQAAQPSGKRSACLKRRPIKLPFRDGDACADRHDYTLASASEVAATADSIPLLCAAASANPPVFHSPRLALAGCEASVPVHRFALAASRA
jgi:hypothetical protein